MMFYNEPSPPPDPREKPSPGTLARHQATGLAGTTLNARSLAIEPGDEAPVPDLGSYLRYVATRVIASYDGPTTATLLYVGEVGCRLRRERAALLGLIVVELVSNALRHAHPSGGYGTIAMRCHRLAGNIVIEVSDNGTGLPDGLDPMQEGPGFGLIRSLAREVGGTLSFTSDHRGFACTIGLPLLSLVHTRLPG